MLGGWEDGQKDLLGTNAQGVVWGTWLVFGECSGTTFGHMLWVKMLQGKTAMWGEDAGGEGGGVHSRWVGGGWEHLQPCRPAAGGQGGLGKQGWGTSRGCCPGQDSANSSMWRGAACQPL